MPESVEHDSNSSELSDDKDKKPPMLRRSRATLVTWDDSRFIMSANKIRVRPRVELVLLSPLHRPHTRPPHAGVHKYCSISKYAEA